MDPLDTWDASWLHPSLRFVVADMHTLPFAPDACAGIVAFYSLIYAADPEPALHGFRRVLQRGAPLLIAVHGGEGSQHFDDYKGTPVDVDLHLRSPDGLASQVRAAGFAVEMIEVRPPYPFEHATRASTSPPRPRSAAGRPAAQAPG